MSRRSRFWSPLCAAGCVAFSLASANGYAAEKDSTGFIPDITVIEIMESIVMPTAQKIWDAVGVDVTAQGQIEKKPQNDEEWAELRAAAVTLAEATNALVVPGRHAAPAGTKSQNPEAELEHVKIILERSAVGRARSQHRSGLHHHGLLRNHGPLRPSTWVGDPLRGPLQRGSGIRSAVPSHAAAPYATTTDYALAWRR